LIVTKGRLIRRPFSFLTCLYLLHNIDNRYKQVSSAMFHQA